MERILIAEDDEKIAWLEKDYLESNGYEARIVDSGDKVIPELMRDSYDLLLLADPGGDRYSHPDGNRQDRVCRCDKGPGTGSG